MSVEVMERILTFAAEDRDFEVTLIEQPATTLRKCGFCIPESQEEEFDRFFREEFSPVFDAFHNRQLIASFMSMPGAKCAACKVSAWSIGTVIIGLGTAGVAALTASSPAVAGLAAFMGATPVVTVAFLSGLAGSVLSDIKALVSAICNYAGMCP